MEETERERQLRSFASRVLAYPDPEGPSKVDLLPAGYPDDLPPELVDVAELRFLGSVVRRRAGELVDTELLFELASGPNELVERYERSLLSAGWQQLKQPGLRGGGFEGSGFPVISVLAHVKERQRVYLQALQEDAGSLLRVHYHGAAHEPLPDELDWDSGRDRSPLPTLKPPPGVRLRPHGSGGGGGRWSSGATAHTDMPPMELESYLASQVEAAGWRRLGGSADEFFAWSSWVRPSMPAGHEWRGVLMVVAPIARERSLWFSAEENRPR